MINMPASKPRRGWRLFKSCLRGMRRGILLLLLLLAALVIYFNVEGLPNFLKQALVSALHERGVELQFSRLRWRWYRGLVAENVRFGSAQAETNSPQLAIQEVEVKLNRDALIRFKFKVDLLALHGGQLVWPLLETNQPAASLSLTNIQSQVRLLTNDQWELDNFTAGFAGAKLHLSGSLTNASALRDWKIFHNHPEAQPKLLRQRLRELARALDQIHFTKPPELNVVLHGDARDVQSFDGLITLEAPGADTPWGNLKHGTLLARLIPPGTNGLAKAEFNLQAEAAQTRWGSARHFRLALHAAGDESLTNVVRARMELSANRIATPWGRATNAQFTAQWTHSLTNPVPIAGTGELRVTDASTQWGNAEELRLNASLRIPATKGPPRADANWGWWAKLEPYYLDWNCHLRNISAEDFTSQETVGGGSWRAPELTVTNLHTEMYQGHLSADASVNVATRIASFACLSDFDVLKATPFLTPEGRKWFQEQQFFWQTPPLAHAQGSVVLPPWINRNTNWTSEMRSTLSLQGDFQVGNASFRQVPVTSAQSHFSYSSMIWSLPDLVAIRPEGRVTLALQANDRTKDYYLRVHSDVDLKSLRGVLDLKARKVMDEFVFTQPPLVDAELWGHFHDYDRLGGKAVVTVSNFSFRGESATYFHGTLDYTNQFLLLTDGRVERSNQYATVSSVGFDFIEMEGYLTNGFSTLEPTALLNAIGPKIAKTMAPYHFVLPPTVHAHGVIPLSDDISVADLHFKVDGGPFEWMKFHLPRMACVVDWTGEHMTLNEAQASFYGGKLTGTAAFDFSRDLGSDFHFDTIVTGVNLQALMADLVTGTNHLEGTLNGHLNITQANSQDTNSWFGKGQIDLRDGLIWDIPIFGLLSPVLDTIVPGLGKSRASEASATFNITNSVIRSDDLEIRSPTIRLLYRGTVGFDTTVNATVEAQVGRDTPLVGPLVSTVFSPFSKLFETKVTGTLKNPKREPELLITRMLTPFMHPWRTLKYFFPGESAPNTSVPLTSPKNSH